MVTVYACLASIYVVLYFQKIHLIYIRNLLDQVYIISKLRDIFNSYI